MTTLATRENLAAAFLANGQSRRPSRHYKRFAADTGAAAGRDHPDAIAARASLAVGLPPGRASRRTRSRSTSGCWPITSGSPVGPDHPDTITARANLALAYRSAGQLREAIGAYERTLADRERVQGRDHADTRSARAHLAAACQRAGRFGDGHRSFRAGSGRQRADAGPGDLETRPPGPSLAAAHFAAGRRAEVIPLRGSGTAGRQRALSRPGSPADRSGARQPGGGLPS